MITDEEAIKIIKKHIRVKYEVYTGKASGIYYTDGSMVDMSRVAEENRALAEWLGKPLETKTELVIKYGLNEIR